MFNSAYVPISTPTTSTSTSTSTPEATPVETSVHNELAAETKTKTAESDSLTNGSLQEILELEDVSIIDVDAPSTNCLQPVDHGKPPDVSSSTIPVEVVFDDFMNGQTAGVKPKDQSYDDCKDLPISLKALPILFSVV
ncbi:hypothetical protein V6N13_064410 [Hibiscus sabdariffa]